MFALVSRGVLVGLLLAQTVDIAPDLEKELTRTRDWGSGSALVTLIATHMDGTPVRGHIQCAGWWFKYEDSTALRFGGTSLPFETDARGAVIMNPSIADEEVYCWSYDKGKYGSVHVGLASPVVAYITMK